MSIEEAVKQAFVLFKGNYGERWKPTHETVAAWMLILGDQQPDDVLSAALRWCREGKEWPPSSGELRSFIPANCRCGDCIRCNSRALAKRLEISNRRSDNDWRSILPPRPTPQIEP